MTVHQLHNGLYLVHCHCLPLEELVRHGRVLLREEGGGEEGAQEGEADNPYPAIQGQQASGRMRPGGLPLGKTPSWSETKTWS